LFNKNGISKFDTDYIDKLSGEEKTSEKFCNSIAGEILVPEDDFLQLINNLSKKTKNISDDEYYEGIARRYKVSREVILRKLLDKGYVDQYFYKEKSNHWLRQMGNKKSGGGNYYLTQKTYLSNKFSREVINKYNENQISIEQASDMLNIKVKNFADLEQEILQGAAA
jgi:Zn-dependent peptidase ImmA (M78 family)